MNNGNDQSDRDVWPPPPDGRVSPTVISSLPVWAHRAGLVSLFATSAAIFIGILALLVSPDVSKRLPHGFSGCCDLLVFVLSIVGFLCGVYGWRSSFGKVGLGLSIISFWILCAIIVGELYDEHGL